MKSMTIYEYLTTIQNIIWNIDKEKLSESIDATINLFDDDFPCSFYMILSQLIYSSFVSKVNDFDICLRFIQEIDKQKSTNKMFEIFTHYLIGLYSQESYYILMKLLEQNLINPKMIQNIQTLYFIHYQPYEINIENSLPFSVQFKDNIKELKENNWELHKKMVKEGINPLEIAKIIRNDEIEKLQEMTSQSKFDFNQIIKPSLYERFSFINDWNVTLIDYAAFFGSIKCFKYLLLNGSKINNTGKYAIAGGNEEIIHLCEQDHSSFYNAYETAIEFHRNDIFKYLYENNIVEIDDLEDLGGKCVLYSNFDLFYYLCEKGMKIKESIIKKSVKIGNLFLLKHFLKENVIQQSFLTLSVNSGNIELVKFILEQKDINVNAINNDF